MEKDYTSFEEGFPLLASEMNFNVPEGLSPEEVQAQKENSLWMIVEYLLNS